MSTSVQSAHHIFADFKIMNDALIIDDTIYNKPVILLLAIFNRVINIALQYYQLEGNVNNENS